MARAAGESHRPGGETSGCRSHARLPRAGPVQLEPEMNAAFSALDLPQCRALRDRWNKLAAQAQLGPDDSLLEKVSPVLGWLADEDANEADGAAPSSAPSRPSKRPSPTGRRRPMGCARPRMPSQNAAVISRSRWRRAITNGRSRSNRLRCAISGSFWVLGVERVLLVVGLMGAIIYRNYHAAVAQRVADHVVELVRDDQLVEARKLLDANSGMSSWEWWLAAERDLLHAEETERGRTTGSSGGGSNRLATPANSPRPNRILSQERPSPRLTGRRETAGCPPRNQGKSRGQRRDGVARKNL